MVWKLESLDELCDFKNGLWKGKKEPFIEVGVIRNTNFTKSGTLDDSDIAYLDVEQKQYATRQLQFGDLILEKSGGGPKQPVGRVIVFDKQSGDFSFSNFTSVVRIKDKTKLDFSFLHKYLYFLYVTGATESMQRQSTGIRNLQLKDYKLIDVPLPPIPEQQRIVAILDQAFADIEKARANAEKNLKNARELFDSYAQNIFSQKKDGWLERSLGELGKVSMCKRILKKQTSASGEIPFYKIGTFGKTANAFIDSDLYEDYKTRFSFPKAGDILISASGTIGRCVVYDGQPAYFQDSNIVWIDNNERLVLNEYLLHFYKVCDWNPSKGATISRLYNDDLRKIKIAFPSKSEQLRVSKDISELNKKILSLQLIYEKKLASLDELKKSLLQKAFSGELTKTEGHAA